jgi:hypothetical protein
MTFSRLGIVSGLGFLMAGLALVSFGLVRITPIVT